MKKQTIAAAIHRANENHNDMTRAALVLDGCPVGGWGETQQAMQRLRELLPSREARSYSVEDFIDAVYRIDAADRYRSKLSAEG